LRGKGALGLEGLVARLASAAYPADRSEIYRHLRAAAREDRVRATPEVVERLAAALRDRGLTTDEHRLSIHARTAVRLLEAAAPTSAWLTAIHQVTRQPLVTLVEEGRVYAWLPGFRDPRVGAPDWVYEITDRIVVRCAVEDVRWESEACVIGGWAHLSHLTADPDEIVMLVLRRRNDGQELRVRARRQRRPDRVKDSGIELTRLAWSGFRADIPASMLLGRPGSWTVAIELERDGFVRRKALSRTPGSALDHALPITLIRRRSDVLRVRWGARGRLVLQDMSRISQAQSSLQRGRRLARVYGRRIARHALRIPSHAIARYRRWALRDPRAQRFGN
jgi:hypothetical protein